VYTNNASLNITAFDVQLVFGEMTDANAEGQLTVERKVKITMSPQHAKVLTVLLARNISKYEDQFGPISLDTENVVNEVKS
jgi:hypothetical protein